MQIRQDPVSGLWCREDGMVLMPPCPTCRTPRHTYEWIPGCPTDKLGHLSVMHQRKFHLVHRIIARAFLPNPGKLPTVDHIDRNPKNNSVGNLRWASHKTQADNTRNVINRVDYGVRCCDDRKAYTKAYDAAYYAAQKAKGLVFRKCADGKRRWVTKESA